jgi:hypothetical protein
MGLDYPALRLVMDWLQVKDQTDAFHRIQHMEAVVVDEYAKHSRAEEARSYHHR